MPTLAGQVTGTASIPVSVRFWSKVERTDTCWVWRGAKSGPGYGAMRISGRRVGTHRLSYELFVGPIPAGMHVCHTCDNPPCCNPAHLFLGSAADNQHDKARKGRAAARSRNGAAKLTDAQFDEVIERVAAGERQSHVARDFGVTPQAVCQFLKRHREKAA